MKMLPDSSGRASTDSCRLSSNSSDRPRDGFDPSGIYYNPSGNHYLVDVGIRYRKFTNKGVVLNGIARFLVSRGVPAASAKSKAKALLAAAEVDRTIDWSGTIAGQRRGLLSKDGLNLLMTTGPEIPDLIPGDFPFLDGIMRGAFPSEDARLVFTGWLRDGARAVRAGMHMPSPMMVLAGGVGTGKSLLAWITSQILGGRIGHPYTTWTGTLPWNDDLAGAELLLIDDCIASTDIRKRKALGASLKESIYSGEVQIRRRHESSVSVRPVWRVLVACNDTPESLAVIPPIDEDLEDKVSMLRVHRVEVPEGTSTPEGRAFLQEQILAELPAFSAHIEQLQLPDHLIDSRRAGTAAWRDPELFQDFSRLSEEARFEELLRTAFDKGVFPLRRGESAAMKSSEVEEAMTRLGSPVRDQAKALLGRHHTVTGRLLGKLEKSSSEIVQPAKILDGYRRWTVTRPPQEQ